MHSVTVKHTTRKPKATFLLSLRPNFRHRKPAMVQPLNSINLDAQPQNSKHLLRQEDVSLLQMFSTGKSELASPITQAGKENEGTLSSFALGADTVA